MDRIRPTDVGREIRRTLTLELDLMREAANNAACLGHQLGRVEGNVCAGDGPILTRTRMITMERAYGIALNDVESLRAATASISRSWPNAPCACSTPRCSETTSSTPTCIRAMC